MSVRRKTGNRLILFRTCHTCGKSIVTTADTPFVRQIVIDGRQVTCYFCSEGCKRDSYKHSGWWDGLADARRKEKEAARAQEKNRRYYTAHAEKERRRARARYWMDPEAARAASKYQRVKRKSMKANLAVGGTCNEKERYKNEGPI